MKFFGFNLSISREAEGTLKREAEPSPFAPEFWPEDGRIGTVLTNAYQQVAWVYRAINALAEQVSNIPFRFSVTSSAGENLITTGPLVDFYGRPHPQINRFQY